MGDAQRVPLVTVRSGQPGRTPAGGPGVRQDMEQWSEIRRLVMTGELNKIQACRKYGLHWKTLEKILRHEEPPGYRQRVPRQKPKIGPFLDVIHQILESGRTAPKFRVIPRSRSSTVAAGAPDARAVTRPSGSRLGLVGAEVFVPLSHPPGEAQVDYGAAEVVVAGQPPDGGGLRDGFALFGRGLLLRSPRNAPSRSRTATSGRSTTSAGCRSGSVTTTRRSPWRRSSIPAATS